MGCVCFFFNKLFGSKSTPCSFDALSSYLSVLSATRHRTIFMYADVFFFCPHVNGPGLFRLPSEVTRDCPSHPSPKVPALVFFSSRNGFGTPNNLPISWSYCFLIHSRFFPQPRLRKITIYLEPGFEPGASTRLELSCTKSTTGHTTTCTYLYFYMYVSDFVIVFP